MKVNKYWKAVEVSKLTLLAKYRRLSAEAIIRLGHFPGRSVDSVSQKMRRMRLGDPEMSRRGRLATRLTAAQTRALDAYIRKHFHHRTSSQIAEAFEDIGVTPALVTDHRRRLGIHLTLREIQNIPLTRRKLKAHYAKLTRINQERSRQLRAERERQFPLLMEQLMRQHPEHECRACIRCGRPWPYTKVFFEEQTKRRGRRVYRYPLRQCRICSLKEYPVQVIS